MFDTLSPGEYRTPPVGGESLIQTGETRLTVKDDGTIMVDSPLWNKPYSIGDGKTFKDPRADLFLKTVVGHQFHHLTTRQLSMVEAYETRPGASRFNRLCGVLDCAKILQDIGSTFEQVFQTTISDLAHPAGSHLRGDYLAGDYREQVKHDENLITYVVRSGLIDKLKEVKIIDESNNLVGSSVSWLELIDPRFPRRYDAAECPRPDGNSDRNQFTLYEGLLIHDPIEVREAVRSLLKVEVEGPEERLAMNNEEAARLLFRLGIRHESEHWGDPVRRLLEELVLLPDRAIFTLGADSCKRYQTYYPVDYVRLDEGEWFRQVNEIATGLPFMTGILEAAKNMAAHQRAVNFDYIGNDNYDGPAVPQNVTLRVCSDLQMRKMWVDRDRLCVVLPRPKYRGPVDSWVASTKHGLRRISQLDPSLSEFEISRSRWVQATYIATLAIGSALARDLEVVVAQLNSKWVNDQAQEEQDHPLNRLNMPKYLLMEQLAQAKQRTMVEALV